MKGDSRGAPRIAVPVLDMFDDNGMTQWFWTYGGFSSRSYRSKRAAVAALGSSRLRFANDEDTDVYGALCAAAAVNQGVHPPFDYWLVGRAMVREPVPYGRVVGRLPQWGCLREARFCA